LSGSARLLIAEYGLMRLGVRMALEGEFEICAEAEDAEGAIVQAKDERPDVCLIGWEIPGEGITAVQGIVNVAPGAAVIVLAATSDVDDLLAAVRAGAIGYVPAGVDGEHLRRVVRAVIAQEAAVPRSMVRDLMLELRGATARGAGGLTGREAQVFGMLRRGHSTTEIARRLEISPVTVRRHISDLVHKLGVKDRAALLRLDGHKLRADDRAQLAGMDVSCGLKSDSAANRPATAPEARSGQAGPDGVGSRLDAVRQVQLGEDVRDMVLSGPRADAQRRGDLAVVETTG
jgi:DNA-binding NarL/FixJ family response regulator